MNNNPAKRSAQPAISGYAGQNDPSPGRGYLWLFVLAVIASLGIAAVALLRPPSAEQSGKDFPETSGQIAPANATSQFTSNPTVVRPRFGIGATSGDFSAPVTAAPPLRSPSVDGTKKELPRTAETLQAAGIIDRLLQIAVTPDAKITPEQAAQISEQIQQVMLLGTPALAAIQDFLDKNVDLTFAKNEGGNFSLRMGLLEALSGIGGPESMAVASRALQSTAVPGEIGLLARLLDQMAPGEYADLALAASREALRSATADPNAPQDIASLFQILQKTGGPGVADELKSFSNQWRYYSLIALNGLPDGAGVPSLVEMATGPGAQATGYQQLASRLLAEVAPNNPEAQRALLDQARAGQISNWDEIAAALGGAKLEFTSDHGVPDPSTPLARVTQTHHVVAGNQSFRTVQSPVPPAQIAQHLSFIDQLLTVTTDPSARATLIQTRAALAPQ